MDANLMKRMAKYIVEDCGPRMEYDDNGPDYYTCTCCGAAVKDNRYSPYNTEKLVHKDDCLYVEVVRFLES